MSEERKEDFSPIEQAEAELSAMAKALAGAIKEEQITERIRNMTPNQLAIRLMNHDRLTQKEKKASNIDD